MALVEPTIDGRSYQEILNEALARIPVHNPEWTNQNDSDPGVTLVQLFAFMTESLLYRANRMPERNRIKFLRLLGLPMLPAAPSSGLVVLDHSKGSLSVERLTRDVEVHAGQIPFRTVDGLYVLPIQMAAYYKAVPEFTDAEREEAEALYKQLYASFDTGDVELQLYETTPLTAPLPGAVAPSLDLQEDTIDGCLWIALLARKPDLVDVSRSLIANSVLTLGIVPALDETARTLEPGGRLSSQGRANLVYERPNVDDDDPATARYALIESRPFGNVLIEPNIVELMLPGDQALRIWTAQDPLEEGAGDFPPSVEDTAIQSRIITWIKIRRGETDPEESSRLNARISFVGINAARVKQEAKVYAEFVGEGSGESEQTFFLVNKPVIRETVRLSVNGEPWTLIDDLAAADPEVPRRNPRLSPGVTSSAAEAAKSKVFTLDRESGEVRFGDGLRGTRPPRGAIILADYSYGGGLGGQVGIGAISKGASLPSGIKVSNPVPTWGGDEAETTTDAERRIQGFLRNRDRVVTEEDYKEITLATPGVDVGRVEVLPLFHPETNPAEGVVTVMVIPKFDPIRPNAPLPDRLFLNTVCEHLNPRRLITTEIHVTGPQYVPIYVSAGIDVIPGRDAASVREAVKEAIRVHLSVFAGGFEETGWPLSRDVEALELLAVGTRVDGVAKVNALELGDSQGKKRDRISIEGLQLPQLVAISVQSGDALPVGDLAGTTTGGGGGGGDDPAPSKRVVPIPIVPETC